MGKGRVSFVLAVFTLLFVFHGVSLADTVANSDGNAASKGDPISTANGEHYFTTTDIFLGGPLPLALSRYYASMLGADGNVTSALGNNWMHNFDLRLVVNDGEATVVYYRGKVVQFQKVGGEWILKKPEPTVYQLVEVDEARLFRLMDPSMSLTHSFDWSDGRLITVEDRNGNVLSLTYQENNLSQVSDGLGRSLTFTYTEGKLTNVQDQSGRSIFFSHTGDNLTHSTDARGNTTRYSYTEAGDLVGLMTHQSRPEGNILYTQTFDDEGRVFRQSDSQNNAFDILYDTPSVGVTTVRDPLDNDNAYTHRELKYLTEHLDPDGESIFISYDGNNRRIELRDRLGDTTSMAYHTFGKLASETDAGGNTTAYTYEAQGHGDFTYYNLVRVDYPDGTFITMTHDGKGNVSSLADGAGEEWVYTYNSRGQVLTHTNPSDGITVFTYDENGNLVSVTDPLGNATGYGYDALNRLVEITYPDGTFRAYTYDANDNPLTVTKGDKETQEVTTAYTYDNNDNLVSITDPLGKTTTIAYDENDRATTFIDRLGKLTTVTHDERGKLETITNATGEKVAFGYNAHGWLDAVTDPVGKVTSMAHDKEGIISAVTDALSHIWRYATDSLGRTTRITTPLGHNDDYTYDSMGRLISHTNPLSQVTAYSYDSRGLLTGMRLPEGISASYTRNELGLITQITDPNGNVWKRAYDEMGRLTSRTDPLLNQTSYAYDSRNRVSRVTFPESSVDFSYDEFGNVTGRLYSDGTDLQYTYDDNNRLLTANGLSLSYDDRGDIIGCNGLSMTRDDVGRIDTLTFAPGKAVTYGYNDRGLVSQVKDWVEGVTQLTYNDAGQLITISRPNGITAIYTYDEDGRLVGVTESAGELELISSIALTRDGAGNITSAVRDVPLEPDIPTDTQEFTYDAASQVEGYIYDGMGRRIEDDTCLYTWDLASRLTSLTEDGNTTAFTYDGLGMRISRTSGGTTQEYVLNYALGLPSVSVVRQEGSDVRYYIHLPGGRLLHSIEAGDNTRRFYHYDEAGTTLFLTDEGGDITDSYSTTPYGMVAVRTGDMENPFTYLGAYGVMQDGDTGLYYVHNRYYDSKTGCFISRDPVASINPYQAQDFLYTTGGVHAVPGDIKINPYQYLSSFRQLIPYKGLLYTTPVSTGEVNQGAVLDPQGGNAYGLTTWPLAPKTGLDEYIGIGSYLSWSYLHPWPLVECHKSQEILEDSTCSHNPEDLLDTLGQFPNLPGNAYGLTIWPLAPRTPLDEYSGIGSYLSWSYLHPSPLDPLDLYKLPEEDILPSFCLVSHLDTLRPVPNLPGNVYGLTIWPLAQGPLAQWGLHHMAQVGEGGECIFPIPLYLYKDTKPRPVRETIKKYYRLFR